MSVTTKNFLKKEQLEGSVPSNPFKALYTQYLAYAKRQEKISMVWYMQVIMVIPCVIMVPTIILMSMATANYIWFVGLTILLFFANVIAFIAGTKSTTYVPLYHASILIMILIPIITNLLNA